MCSYWKQCILSQHLSLDYDNVYDHLRSYGIGEHFVKTEGVIGKHFIQCVID